MKKTSATSNTIIFSIAIVAAFLLSSCTPAEATPTPTAPAAMMTATTMLTATITTTPDPCASENIEATIMEFDKLSREFSDAFVLAQNTPAVELGAVIPEMQAIRRKAEDFKIASCLNTLKGHQLGFMNTAINTTLILYSSFSGDKNLTNEQANAIFTQVNQQMAQANEFGNQYTIEMARLLGVTLQAPPTPQPTLVGTATTPEQ